MSKEQEALVDQLCKMLQEQDRLEVRYPRLRG